MSHQDTQTQAIRETLPSDDVIWQTPHEDMLRQSVLFRKRWFYLLQLSHRELDRVVNDLLELMDPNNDVKIVSIIGMTGIGKTTLANELNALLDSQYGATATPDQCPVLHVSAPANGEKSLSWRMLYRRILEAGAEPDIDHKRPSRVTDGELHGVRGDRQSVASLRGHVEKMLRHRKVRALIVDEALHLLRFSDYSAIMDTLKSLADIGDTKLVLIGTHQIADLMIEYGQVVRRSEIVHYKRYQVNPKSDKPMTADETEYREQLMRFQEQWPCRERPNLVAIWRPMMMASLGSIGLTKSILLRLLTQQMATPGEKILAEHFSKAIKGEAALRILEKEATEGEAKLVGACYGDGKLTKENLMAVLKYREVEVAHA